MKKILKFGKIDYFGRGRKINAVDVSIELKNKENKEILSICGNIWNSKHSDLICGGQCLDEIYKFLKNDAKFIEVYRLWKLYHLNDMHPGTKKQEEFLNYYKIKNWANEYEKTCKILQEYGLLYDDGVKFGSTWHYWEIPQNDLEKIKKIINEW